MGDTSETNTKVLYRELFLGVVALKMPILQNHYLCDKVPFLKSGHIYIYIYIYMDTTVDHFTPLVLRVRGKYVCQNAWAELRGPNTRTLKVSFGRLKPTCDTRIFPFDYTLEQL